MKESFPLIFSGFAILIYMKIDQIMLGQMVGNTAVGVYSAAVSATTPVTYGTGNKVVFNVVNHSTITTHQRDRINLSDNDFFSKENFWTTVSGYSAFLGSYYYFIEEDNTLGQ